MLIAALFVDAFCVMSRSAIISFSLADMEERLRSQDRIQADMPRFEAFAEIARDVAFTFLLLSQVSKAVAVISIFTLLEQSAATSDPGLLMVLTLLAFGLFILLGDNLPRPVATAKAEVVTQYCLGLWKFLHLLFYLPVFPFRLLSNGINTILSNGEENTDDDQAEDEIIAAVAFGEAQGHILEEERGMIEAVLEFRDKTAADVMSPRTDMSAVALEDGTIGALEVVKETGHSRLPVYTGNRDNIVGILYAKDLLGVPIDELPELDKLLRQPVLVPSSKRLTALLAEMRRDRVHLVVVLDEFGGTAGLVSIEDIIEEVFGEIEDEYDAQREEEVRQLDVSTFDLDARMKVEEVNERFDYNLPLDSKYESLGGLVTSNLGCIPKPGAKWNSEDGSYLITVLEATPRRVVRICLERQSAQESDES